MIAKVIVDVPSRQTDRPFDYAVPESLAGWVEVGSRVGVPFGGRVVQGFVVELSETAAVDRAKLKPIAELLDHTPPLSPDLIELGEWISEKYCCTMTAALQAMLPSALKGKAETYVSLVNEEQSAYLFEADWFSYIRSKGGTVKLSTLQEKFPLAAADVKTAIRDGLLEQRVAIRDRLAIRKVLTVYPPADLEAARQALAELPARALKQREVLQHLLDTEEPVALQKLIEAHQTTASTVRALESKGHVLIREVEQERDPYAGRQFKKTVALPLMEGQRQVFGEIAEALDARESRIFLLHGVTGSGKTEVYLQSIERCLMQGRQAIVLVPEISLTPQMVERFKGRFGDAVAVLHSRLSNGERYDEWRKIQERRASVAIGARSAIFAPFKQLGLIIIDEEHESSYKQEETPKYHARDVAVRRARQHGAAVVLGSATPSLESYTAAARAGGSQDTRRGAALLPMPERVGGRPMPPVHIIDMREELRGGNRAMFSQKLHDALKLRLERGEQSVLLLNRRGYSTFVMCRSCGYTAQCPHCDISLTYHQKSRVLRCHYCGHAEGAPTTCPSCESEHIRFFGTGTQRVEEELSKLFPGIRVIRMDVDTTTEKGSHEKWLTMFGERKADVLLGTQMVAKGLDFPYVTLVGVIAADTSLHLPDFRSAEKTFQLLTQVAGRAGRHELEGEVVIQSYNPEHYAITTAQHHDYEAFVQEELRHRRQMAYPPFCRLILITLSHEQLPLVIAAGEKLASMLRASAEEELSATLFDQGGGSRFMEVLGPVASPIPRMKDRYRFQCMVKYRGNIDAAGLVSAAAAKLSKPQDKMQVLISVDVDPQVIL
ncbi:primosomal protein N' (replication factor Y) [Paenibacillus phyllosphaerae]|uniref:Replication restart protein PriA n=1 Tax=Paenibacillus phyllosphaerae TaxID=274593 RepID=A0A7W5FMP7_9BACL|nr:primosomal protein N' [Paenibacillus phyllosphaerae]MBB3110470.1 primosomal protein N' (replication factor Y) [Paenibacillus phyllosphaerae]